MTSRRWSDLGVRIASGLAMALVGAFGIWAGGHVFHLMVSVICGLMIWELVRMIAPTQGQTALQLGFAAGISVLVASYVPGFLAIAVLVLPLALGFKLIAKGRPTYLAFGFMIVLAGLGMISLRDEMGLAWMIWLVGVVVATDVLGYFAGRLIGGPKFWPRISPKKTWSGTIGGWCGAALVGWAFMQYAGLSSLVILASVAMSLASQMGDILESSIKRRAGVKDSSNLIPGHGGLLDRFDGMLGAAIFLMIAGTIYGLQLWG